MHALALVSAAYSYALIRATTVAHGHLHQAQLDVAARNSSEVPHRSRRVSNLPRVPTRIVRSGIADIPEHGCPSMSRPLRPSSRMGSFRNFMRGSKDDPMAGGILSNLSRGRHSATIPGTEIVPSVVPSPAQQSVSRFQKVDVRFVEAPARQHSSAIASSTGSGHGDHGGTEEGGAGGVAKHRSRPKSLKAALREEVEEVLQAAAADGNARGSLEMMRGGPPAGSGMGIDAAAGGGGGDTGGEANGERVGRERGGEGGAEKASTGGEEGALVLDGVFSAEIGHVGGAVAPIDVEEGGKEGRKGAEGERGRSRSPSGTAR